MRELIPLVGLFFLQFTHADGKASLPNRCNVDWCFYSRKLTWGRIGMVAFSCSLSIASIYILYLIIDFMVFASLRSASARAPSQALIALNPDQSWWRESWVGKLQPPTPAWLHRCRPRPWRHNTLPLTILLRRAGSCSYLSPHLITILPTQRWSCSGIHE